MLLCQPAGPGTLGQVFQRFRFPDPGERVIQNRPDDRKRSRSDLALCLDPVLKILDELGMEDGRLFIGLYLPFTYCHHLTESGGSFC